MTDSEMRFAWMPKFLNKILDFLPEILLIVAGVFIGATGVPVAMSWATSILVKVFPNFTEDDAQISSFALGTVITVINVIVATLRKKSRTGLELSLRKLRNSRLKDLSTLGAVLDRSVEELARDREVWNAHTRVSLYRHGSETKSFIRLARVSSNPQLCNGGRQFYPDTEGLIADVWTHGVASSRDLKENRDDWNQELVDKMGYDLSTASILTMQSRSMVGVRLDFAHKPVGVVIIESNNPRGVSARIIDDIKGSDWLGRTATLFAVSRENILNLVPEGQAMETD